jgi:hypothetical protein
LLFHESLPGYSQKGEKWDRSFARRFVLTRIGLGVVPSQSRYTDVATD